MNWRTIDPCPTWHLCLSWWNESRIASRQLPQWPRSNAPVAVSISAFPQHRDSHTEGAVRHLLCHRQSTRCTSWIVTSQCSVWLCRPWYFTASVACEIWRLWNSAWLDCIILVWSITAGTVQWTSVCRVAAAVWNPARVISRPCFDCGQTSVCL